MKFDNNRSNGSPFAKNNYIYLNERHKNFLNEFFNAKKANTDPTVQ